MRPTRIPVLVVVALVVGAVAYAVLDTAYSNLPPVPLYAPVTLLFLAVAEWLSAHSVRARLAGRPGTRPIMPMAVARLAALAKASALAGTLAFGAYAGLFAYTLRLRDKAVPAHDAVSAAFGAATSVLLVVAALLLERCCRLPGGPDTGHPHEDDDWNPVRDWHR